MSRDVDLYATWHHAEGGIVALIVPGMGEVRMSLAKAEDVAASLRRYAEYGREAAKAVQR